MRAAPSASSTGGSRTRKNRSAPPREPDVGSGVPTRWRQVGILLQIAFRDLFASRAKTLIVGGIILAGAVLVVVGSSFVDSIDAGMRTSIQGSLAGHIQVYDARSKDDLALYGGMSGEPDL